MCNSGTQELWRTLALTTDTGILQAGGGRGGPRPVSGRLRLLPAALLIAALAGCASSREKQSFDEYYRVEAEYHPVEAEGETPETGVPELGEESTLADYLVYAALRNPGLEAAFNEWKAALEMIPQVRSLPDPRFTYAYYIDAVETRVGPQEQSFALVQTFPWLGKLRRRGDVAFEASEAARQKYEAAKLRLFYQVKQAYYEYYYLHRSIDIMRDNLGLVNSLEAVARGKFQAGLAPYAAVVKAQVEMGKLDDQLKTLEDLRGPTAAGLNAALGRSPGSYLPWPRPITMEQVAFTDEEVLNSLREANPELLALGFMTAREEAAMSLARHSYVPDITLGATLIQTGEAVNPELTDSGKDAVMATLSLNLPIWFGKYRAAQKEAQARHHATAKRREDLENHLVTDLKMAVFHFRSAERRIDLYGDSLVPKAEQSLSASQRAFSAGEADFFDLIDAQRTLLEFQLAYERALADRAQKLAKIEMLTGEEILYVQPGAD
jgi:cobalt-zinc-cadmium efflux system outer membrane protein